MWTMRTMRTFLACLALAYLAAAPAAAEDIDLFLTTPSAEVSLPNVLIVIDNGANWNADAGDSKREAITKQALRLVLSNPDFMHTDGEPKFNVGVMLLSPRNRPQQGSYVYSRIQPLTPEHRDALVGDITDGFMGENGLTGSNGLIDQMATANNSPYALALHEAYRYYAGMPVRSGIPDTSDHQHDPAAIDDNNRYIAPIASSCQRNFIIFIGNGSPDSSEDGDAKAELAALPDANMQEIILDPYSSSWMDEHARYLSRVNLDDNPDNQQNIVTHTIALYDPDLNRDKQRQAVAGRALLDSTATQGRGRYFPVHNTAGLAAAIESVLQSVQAVNSVFASTSLPVSVNVRGTHLNQVYMGVFRPDEGPRWHGNLKLYQLGYNATTGEVFLADRHGRPAQSGATGFIEHDAVSFWTTPSTYWAFDPRGIPLSASDSPDGAVVEKGGVAQKLRQGSGRNVYSCTGSCSTITPFESTQASTLGLDPALINWVRGDDNQVPPERDSSGVRPSVHGDVLHSQPAVLNYSNTDVEVVVFYGSNDGHFRAVRGGMNEESVGGTWGGEELWSFVFPEFFDRLDTLHQNEPAGVGEPRKPYFADGSIGVHRKMGSDGRMDEAWLFISMRRGGRLLYAMNVTDPDNPQVMWRRSPADEGWAELGQTWSLPQVTRIRGYDDPVLIFGAGYDPEANDRDRSTGELPDPATATMGRGVFVVNAATGDIVLRIGPDAGADLVVEDMKYSIPSDMSIVKLEDERADRMYFGDVGGNVWRVEMGDTLEDWEVHQLASLSGTGEEHARRFLYRPDVVRGNDGQPFYAVVLASGNREDPFNNQVYDRLYMLKDRPWREADDPPLTEDDLTDITAEASSDTPNGWYLRLAQGEKGVGTAQTLDNNVTFATNEPAPQDPSVCINLGVARIYSIDFRNGGGRLEGGKRSITVPGGGFPPSPVYFITTVDDGHGGTRLVEGSMLGPNIAPSQSEPLQRRTRTFWYRDHEDDD